MSSEHPPLTDKQVIAALLMLGFAFRKATSGTSHDSYIGMFRGQFRKVTVDCPKSPFGQDLVVSEECSRACGSAAFALIRAC